jgi:SP family arabinose:H+ symporter-like MFS transporter
MKNKINFYYLTLLTVVAALGGLLFGFDIAIITGAGPFIETHFNLQNNQLGLGFSFASLLFGCMFGAFFSGRITDLYGRKKILAIIALLFVLTSLLTGISSSYSMFVTVRFFGGLAVGAVSLLSPMYIAEVSPAQYRGRLVSFYQFSITLGILISYFINYLLHDIGEDNWRWMFITGTLPSVLFFILLFLVPETPRFLFKIGKDIQAYNILKKIGGENLAKSEIGEIRESLSVKGIRFADVFKPDHYKMLLIGLVLAILVQLSGINAIIDYAPKIFTTAGFKIDAALFGTFGLGIVNVIFTVVSIYSIDKIGRRALYIIGSGGMALSLIILTVMSYSDRFEGPFVLALCIIYLAFFAGCVGPVFWTIVSEIFPNNIRGTAMIVPVTVQWFFNALMVWLFPEMLKNFRTGTFLVIALMALLQLGFTLKWIPETKGKSLEAIEKIWKKQSKG